MITLNSFAKLDNNQYQMVLSMKKTDSVEDLPSETRPMSPEYFAVTVDYGTPAYGSVVIKESGETLTYSAGKWGKAETAGDIKLKELSVKENGKYLPEGGYVGFNKVLVDVKPKEMPIKGDLIMLDGKQYRVLKINDTVSEVLAMYDAISGIEFDSAASGYNNIYAGKNIDTYCNDTFYSGLSSAMKVAIVDKTFTQDSWKLDTSFTWDFDYIGRADPITYYLTLKNASYGSSIARHCYCLSIQDVLDYLDATTSMNERDTTLTDTNLWKMFWNEPIQSNKYVWLRSAGSFSNYAFYVDGGSGDFTNGSVGLAWIAARPAFQIDLSKVDWTKSE